MARYLGPRLRLSRREGMDLMLTSAPGTSKSKKFETAPGQHGSKKPRLSVYGNQLRAKQAIKRQYGVLERQFRRYYFEAARRKGATGEILLQLLEMRMDNIVYRAGFAATRAEARQMVSHKAFLLNDKVVNIPSCQIKAGDVIEVRVEKRNQGRIRLAIEAATNRPTAEWLEVDYASFKAKVKAIPSREHLPSEINENAVVELYSK